MDTVAGSQYYSCKNIHVLAQLRPSKQYKTYPWKLCFVSLTLDWTSMYEELRIKKLAVGQRRAHLFVSSHKSGFFQNRFLYHLWRRNVVFPSVIIWSLP